MRLFASLHFGTGLRAAVVVLAVCVARGQQVPDTSFAPPIEKPAFAYDAGPAVLIDEAHSNFHTATGRYLPFAELLRRDGYVVSASKEKFTVESLKRGRVLVISNALNERNAKNWSPPHSSAFTNEEINALQAWVREGGSLFLIADHMPFAGAAEDLGRAFGIRFRSGYAIVPNRPGNLTFRKADGTLRDHVTTRDINSIVTFTGSSFQADGEAQPLLVFGKDVVSVKERDEPNPPAVTGDLQGALMRFGKGRLAVFGEAAMFSAQLAGPNKEPMGMNAPEAKENSQFLLNVIHWLTGRL